MAAPIADPASSASAAARAARSAPPDSRSASSRHRARRAGRTGSAPRRSARVRASSSRPSSSSRRRRCRVHDVLPRIERQRSCGRTRAPAPDRNRESRRRSDDTPRHTDGSSSIGAAQVLQRVAERIARQPHRDVRLRQIGIDLVRALRRRLQALAVRASSAGSAGERHLTAASAMPANASPRPASAAIACSYSLIAVGQARGRRSPVGRGDTDRRHADRPPRASARSRARVGCSLTCSADATSPAICACTANMSLTPRVYWPRPDRGAVARVDQLERHLDAVGRRPHRAGEHDAAPSSRATSRGARPRSVARRRPAEHLQSGGLPEAGDQILGEAVGEERLRIRRRELQRHDGDHRRRRRTDRPAQSALDRRALVPRRRAPAAATSSTSAINRPQRTPPRRRDRRDDAGAARRRCARRGSPPTDRSSAASVAADS